MSSTMFEVVRLNSIELDGDGSISCITRLTESKTL